MWSFFCIFVYIILLYTKKYKNHMYCIVKHLPSNKWICCDSEIGIVLVDVPEQATIMYKTDLSNGKLKYDDYSDGIKVKGEDTRGYNFTLTIGEAIK